MHMFFVSMAMSSKSGLEAQSLERPTGNLWVRCSSQMMFFVA